MADPVLGRRDRAELTEEGEALVRFVEPGAKSFDVRFAELELSQFQ